MAVYGFISQSYWSGDKAVQVVQIRQQFGDLKPKTVFSCKMTPNFIF